MCPRGNPNQAFPFLRKSEETHGDDSRDAIVRVVGDVLALLIKVVTLPLSARAAPTGHSYLSVHDVSPR